LKFSDKIYLSHDDRIVMIVNQVYQSDQQIQVTAGAQGDDGAGGDAHVARVRHHKAAQQQLQQFSLREVSVAASRTSCKTWPSAYRPQQTVLPKSQRHHGAARA
jgi:hypothetical protein